jgi:hypothetical protein
LSSLVFFTFNVFVFLVALLKSNNIFKLISFFILYIIVLSSIKFDFYSDLIAYKENIEQNSILSLEPGWEFITRSFYSLYKNSAFVLTTIILFNIFLTVNLLSKLNLNNLESRAFSLFLITKWFLYSFVVIRFGLASLIMLNLLAIFESRDKKSLIFIGFCLLSCVIHYSIIILIVIIIISSIKNQTAKIILSLISLLLLYYLYSQVTELDSRVLRYFEVDELVVNYNWIHILIMSIFSLIILFNYFKVNKPFDLLILFLLAISNILLQPFDAVNRIVYVLIIYFLFKCVRTKLITPLTSYSLILLSVIFLLRNSLFAPIDKSLTF